MDWEEEINRIVGPVFWHHGGWSECNCSDDAPEDPEAYMSDVCRRSYNAGVRARQKRIEALMQHIRRERADVLMDAASKLPDTVHDPRHMADLLREMAKFEAAP